jgi:NADH-quinone oxidoreductase subunit N
MNNGVHGLSITDYLLMLPMLELAIFALGILLIDLMIPRRWKWLNAAGALAGTLFAAACVWRIQFALPPRGLLGFYNSLLVDRFAIYFWYLFLAGTAISILISAVYLHVEDEHRGEYYAAMLLSVVGMMCMAAGIDVVLMFVGLQLMVVSLYVLVGFLRRERRSKSAFKYMLHGALSSGIFVYGLSLFYGFSGGTNLATIARWSSGLNAQNPVAGMNPHNPVVMIALFATMTGLLFEIGAAPFHRRIAGAYEHAPTSAAAFLSVVAMLAAWALLLRVLLYGLWSLRLVYIPVLIFVAIASLTVGNIAALFQTNTKRLLACSSIAHVGYMLLGLVAVGTSQIGSAGFVEGFKGVLIYLIAYTLMNLGAFAVITSLRQRDVIGDQVDGLAGLYRRAPLEAVLMLLFLLSLAGIPPTAGFLGKYYVFQSLFEGKHYALAAVGLVYSLFGLYFYLKIAYGMFKRVPKDTVRLRVDTALRCAIGVTALATLVIGIYPTPVVNAVNWTLAIQQTRHASAVPK